MITRPESLFGIPTGLSHDEAASIAASLTRAWLGLFSRVPGGLNSDLELLKSYFHPIAQGARLRRLIANVPEVDNGLGPLPQLLLFQIGERRGLVTPEGRIALEVLKRELGNDGDVVIDLTEIAWANRVVADLYRSWTRERLRDVASPDAPLQVPVVGFALTMLVNGSVGREHALPIPRSDLQEEQLSRVIGPIVDAFVDAIRRQNRREPFRLRGGWIVTETTRHLFGAIDRDGDLLWVREDADERLPRELAAALAKRKYNRQICESALDALLGAYRAARPELASFGLSHERPSRTNRIRKAFLEALPTT